MHIRVRHETKYVYSAPLFRSTQYLRITPRHDDGQAVSGWRVTAPGKLSEWQDHHHNICHTLVVDQPVEQLSVVGEGLVETTETYGVTPAMPYDLPTAIYLRQTDFTRPDTRLRRFADKFRRAVADDLVKGLHALMLGVREVIDYQENETHVHTTAAEALAEGAGSVRTTPMSLSQRAGFSAYPRAMSAAISPARTIPWSTPPAMPGQRRSSPISAGSASIPPMRSRPPSAMSMLPRVSTMPM
jgi:hypothetical protein